MAQHSKASLEVAPVTELDRRMTPPADLSAYEAQVFSAIVATKPADWFQADCVAVLVSYCKHISAAAVLDSLIAQFDPEGMDRAGLKDYTTLLSERRKETAKIESTATKLRLTPQSRYNTQSASTADRNATKGKKKLWEQ